MKRYLITYNGKEVKSAETYTEANTIANSYGNGVFEEILITDTYSGEILTNIYNVATLFAVSASQ